MQGHQVHLSDADIAILQCKFWKLLDLGVIRKATEIYLVSSVFVVHQSEKDRETFDATLVNEFLLYQKVKMEILATARALVCPGDYGLKFDISKTYNTFVLHPSHRMFLQFRWPGTDEVYEYIGCPFGLAHLPRLMARIMEDNFVLDSAEGAPLLHLLGRSADFGCGFQPASVLFAKGAGLPPRAWSGGEHVEEQLLVYLGMQLDF